MALSDLIVHAEPWQWATLGGLCVVLTGLLYGWGEDRPAPPWLLALLRFGTLAILAFLLLEPMLRTTTETIESPTLPVLVDQTSSQWMGKDSLARRLALDVLVKDLPEWGDAQGWDVELFGFDRVLSPLEAADWNPRGKRTDLGSALEGLRDRYMHRNVPGVLVVTDGRANRGPDPEYSASKLQVPHVFVGTGDTALVADLDLSVIRMNEVAYLGNAFPVEITAQGRGFEEVPVEISLHHKGTQLGVQNWTPAHSFSSYTWTLEVDALEAGTMELEARIQPRMPGNRGPDEVSLANNRRQANIDILESRRQIVFLANAPHPDLAALRAAAESNRHQETQMLWLSDWTPTSTLPDHDVLVLHQVRPNLMPPELARAVAKSPALWLCGGHDTPWDTWGESLVGFDVQSEPLITEARGRAVQDFDRFPMPTDLSATMQLWPPLACPTGTYEVTPALRVALSQKVGPVDTGWPLWAVCEHDGQRVASTLGEGLWRWRIQDLAQHDGTSLVFDELVNHTLQYLSSRDDVKRLRIRGPERLDEDLRCLFRAEVYDVSLTPTVESDVTFELLRRNGEPTGHRFVPSPRGTDMALDLGFLLPGVYDWTASCRQGGEDLVEKGTLVVHAVQAEASLLPANHGLLQRLAERSNGSYLGDLNRPEDVALLRDAWKTWSLGLGAKDVVHASSERLPLHAQTWLLVVLLGLLTAEWTIRRSSGGR